MVMSHQEERIKNELADLARSSGLDALLVFNVQKYDAIPGKGVGVWLRTLSLSSIQRAWVHSNIDLTIVGTDGTVIANIVGLPEMPKPLDPSALGIKYEMRDSMRPELPDRSRSEMLEHLEKSVNKRFDQLQFR